MSAKMYTVSFYMFFIHLLYSIRTPIIQFPHPSKPDRRNVGWYVAMKNLQKLDVGILIKLLSQIQDWME